MNDYSPQQNALQASEEMMASLNLVNQKEPTIFPKSDRAEDLSNMPMKNFKMHLNQQGKCSDANAEAELLENLPKKELNVEESSNQVVSWSPYFRGSPPVRTTNPLVRDPRFGDEKNIPILTILSPTGLSSPSSAPLNRGCVRMSFGLKPAAVRVEGFDCLKKDRKNSGISATS